MFDFENSQLFETLPKSVKENIAQGDVHFDNEEEFLKFVTKFENTIS